MCFEEKSVSNKNRQQITQLFGVYDAQSPLDSNGTYVKNLLWSVAYSLNFFLNSLVKQVFKLFLHVTFLNRKVIQQ